MLSKPSLTLGVTILTAACSSGGEQQQDLPPIRSLDPTPALERVPVQLPQDEHPWGPISLALSPGGTVAYLFGQDDPPYLTLLGTDGAVMTQVGPRGEGPGELSGAGVIVSDGGGFVVLDGRRAAAVRFSSIDGAYLSEYRFQTAGFVLAAVGDSVDVFDGEYAMRELPAQIARVSLATGEQRTIVSESDSVFAAAAGVGSTSPRNAAPIPYFASPTHMGWADGDTYAIRVLALGAGETTTIRRDLPPNHRGPTALRLQRAALERATGPARRPDGTPTPPSGVQARIDTLDRETVPYILPGGLGLDAAGRVIAVGVLGDSVFVDFFRDSTFLHRAVIDCFVPGRVAVGADRIALHCRDRAQDAPSYELQVWKFR